MIKGKINTIEILRIKKKYIYIYIEDLIFTFTRCICILLGSYDTTGF